MTKDDEARYHWVIEWVPEDLDFVGDEHRMIGTREEAERECERRHPDYFCREIVFHRCGKTGDGTRR